MFGKLWTVKCKVDFFVKTILCFEFEVGLDLDKNLKTWIYLTGFQLPIQSLDFTPILSKKSLNVLFVVLKQNHHSCFLDKMWTKPSGLNCLVTHYKSDWERKQFVKCVFLFMFQSLYFERKFFKTSLPKESMNGLDIHETTVVAVHNNFIVIARLENHM